MAVYKVFIEKAVFKRLRSIPEKDYQKIMISIAGLANDPRPPGYKKLKGRPGYRIREGNYRIIYEINDRILTVTVVEAGDRKDIYE
ncbi:MAG TPA: type II toxin-antitoxin system RelE/ParE family toxin [Bacteroidales bacterium]|nr:type II toxin-antitoxin system RelE/ParE family toxin [Bacteroidales bacterium]